MNPKFFRNGIVMLVLVVGTAALLFTWITTTGQPTNTGYSAFLAEVSEGKIAKVTQQGTTLTVERDGEPKTTYTVIVPTVLTHLTYTTTGQPTNTGYSAFLAEVSEGKIAKVTQQGTTLTVERDGEPKTTYTVIVPTVLTQVFPDMLAAAETTNLTLPADIFQATPAPDTSWLGLLLTAVLPLLIIGGFIFFMMRQAQGTNNQALCSARAARACSWATRRSSRSPTWPAWTRPRPSSRKWSSS